MSAVIQTNPIDTLLSRLEGVKQTGAGRWIAKCPAHEDRSPSLSIRECSDQTILIHDFAGCDTASILAAVDLELRDLFPAPLTKGESLKPKRNRIHAMDALRVLAHESRIIAIAANDIADNRSLSADDANRVALAAGRIGSALDAVGGGI